MAKSAGQKTNADAPAEAAPRAQAGERVAKAIARAGACSRRDAESLIAEGRVCVNGVVLDSPAVVVAPSDAILIDGAPLAQRAHTRLFLFHKPRGLVTTDHDPEGRETVFDYLRRRHPDAPRLVSIGRLDINTEGLLLLTNDGGLARVLELPSTGWVRRYRVRANGATDQAALDRLRGGVAVDGVDYAEIEATLDRTQGANCWLSMSLREGKNREIKRVLEHLGLAVNRLIRLSYGPFQLAALEEGGLEEVRTRVLRDQLGPALAEAAGADFSASPREDAEPRRNRAPPPARQPRASLPAQTGAVSAKAAFRGPRERDKPGRGEAAEPPPPRKKPAPAKRKHVSALRGEAEAPTAGRKRIERGATADRSGRAVAVERRVAARPERLREARPSRQARGAPRAGDADRRFDAEATLREKPRAMAIESGKESRAKESRAKEPRAQEPRAQEPRAKTSGAVRAGGAPPGRAGRANKDAGRFERSGGERRQQPRSHELRDHEPRRGAGGRSEGRGPEQNSGRSPAGTSGRAFGKDRRDQTRRHDAAAQSDGKTARNATPQAQTRRFNDARPGRSGASAEGRAAKPAAGRENFGKVDKRGGKPFRGERDAPASRLPAKEQHAQSAKAPRKGPPAARQTEMRPDKAQPDKVRQGKPPRDKSRQGGRPAAPRSFGKRPPGSPGPRPPRKKF